MNTAEAQHLFRLDFSALGPVRLRLANLAQAAIRPLLGLPRLEKIYRELHGLDDPAGFLRAALAALDVSVSCRPQDWQRIPRQGGAVVVANHPFGALEGMVLARELLGLRPDVKILANHLLGRIPELRDLFIFVDPFDATRTAAGNLGPLRRALSWVKKGGLLVVFPAGEVAHLEWRSGRVREPKWNEVAAYIADKGEAPVVPLFFPGRNSLSFQVLGLLHPGLRTLLLPRELANKAGGQISLVVGGPIAPRRHCRTPGYAAATAYLRLRTRLLGEAVRGERGLAAYGRARASRPRPLAAPEDPAALRREIAFLPAEQTLLTSGGFDVFYAYREQAPRLVNHIGRLRELSFRQAGEGTGAASDLDRFDEHYLHLCLWDQRQGELAGGYRLGPVDDILARQGRAGLYTSTLFAFAPEFFRAIPGALELGRSFIVPRYQRSYSALLLLWKGIGHFIMANPRYRYLFGAVSVARDYKAFSRRLLMEYTMTRRPSELSGLVTPLTPPRLPAIDDQLLRATLAAAGEFEEISEIIADLEDDGRGAPILFKQYLKLAARCAGWNLDRNFSNVLDCLLVADLMEAEVKTLERYCGTGRLAAYRALHGARGALCRQEAEPARRVA